MNYRAPFPDTDESRLGSMDEAIKQLEAAHAAELAKRAEENARRAKWDAQAPAELEAWKLRRAELAARIDARRVHVQTQAQLALTQQRKQQLAFNCVLNLLKLLRR